jgi:C4-dicarboxylate-specific signal transduction histidine kinase
MASRDMPPPALSHAVPIESVAAVEAALGRVTESLDQTERLATLGTLAAGVCHEVGNILTPVLAYAQLALANPEDHELHAKALHKVVLGVETATRIAESILGFAGTNDASECDVCNVVHVALDCIARDPNKDRITVKIDVQS